MSSSGEPPLERTTPPLESPRESERSSASAAKVPLLAHSVSLTLRLRPARALTQCTEDEDEDYHDDYGYGYDDAGDDEGHPQ